MVSMWIKTDVVDIFNLDIYGDQLTIIYDTC